MSEFAFDTDNPVVALCMAGTQAEFAGRPADAHALYLQAWDARRSDLDACVAAHYVARHQATPEETLRWNRIALEHADAAGSDDLRGFYPSLYLNLAKSCQETSNIEEARRYYGLAANSASRMPDKRYSEMVRNSHISTIVTN